MEYFQFPPEFNAQSPEFESDIHGQVVDTDTDDKTRIG